jgi:outer membrane protein
VRSYGLGTQARYQWNPQWESHAFVEYTRLTADVANSPVVTQRGSPDQAMFGVGATYSFDIPALW